jgi:hypothetical protein
MKCLHHNHQEKGFAHLGTIAILDIHWMRNRQQSKPLVMKHLK